LNSPTWYDECPELTSETTHENRLNRAYYGLVDMDQSLVAGFRRKYASPPVAVAKMG
jgi:hypothetical protein